MVNKFDTQFLIEGSNLDEDDIRAGIMASAEGDCLIVVVLLPVQPINESCEL